MWLLLKVMLAQWAVRKLVWKGVGSLLFLLPLGAMLKLVGWPVLMVLGVLALPVLLFLLVIGLPILLVLLLGGRCDAGLDLDAFADRAAFVPVMQAAHFRH